MQINTSTMDTVALDLNSRESIQIQKKYLLAGLLLRFFGTFTVTGGDSAGTLAADPVARLIRNLEVRSAAGSRVSVAGVTLAAINRLFERGAPTQDNPTSLAAATAEAFEVFLRVPFSMPHSSVPNAFAYNTMGATAPTLLLDVGYGREAKASSTGTGAITVPDFSVEVISEAMYGPDVSPSAPYGSLVIRQEEHPVTVESSARKFYLDELGRGTEIRAIIIEGLSGGSGGEYFTHDNGVVTSVRLHLDGGDAVERTSFGTIRQRNARVYQLSAAETGIGVIDAAEDFDTTPGHLYSVLSGQRPFLELGVAPQGAGDSKVRITTLTAERGRAI